MRPGDKVHFLIEHRVRINGKARGGYSKSNYSQHLGIIEEVLGHNVLVRGIDPPGLYNRPSWQIGEVGS